MPLNDPSLLTALKAQIQIGGTPQVNTFQATFHYQMAYRVQNHSLDILVPGQDNAGDALMIDVDSNATPTCTYVPRQLSREELVKLLPEKWITNYEQIHQAPVRSTSAPEFVRHENGLVEIKFSSSQPKSDNVFPTGIHMITPTDQEPAQEIKHIWWDVCNCESCLDEAAKIDDDDDIPKKRKSSQQKLKRRYEKGDPTVGLLGEPSGKFDYYVLYPKAEPSQPLSPPQKTPPTSPTPPKLSPYNQKALSILHQDPPMFPITKGPSCSYSQEYEQEFPALTAFEHLDSRTKHDWKIKNPTTIGPTGQANTISPAEATLNWQSENAVAQNKVLVKILSQQGMITNSQEYLSSKVRSLESIINELRFKIQELHRDIIQIIRTSPTTQPSSSISQKEAEMKNLKNQLQDLERQHKQKRTTSLVDDPWRLPSTPFKVNKPSTKRRQPFSSQESQSIADVALTKTPDVLPIQKANPVSMFLNSLTQTDKPQNTQFIAPVIKPQKDYEEFDNVESFEHLFMAEPENAESTVQFDAEEYEEHQENLNQETPTEFPKSDIKQYFTFDDVPPSKWRERSIEMLTWLQGRLRDWYHSLGEYRQLQIQQSISPEAFMSIIYSEFIGSPWEHATHAREEFLKIKYDEPSDSVLYTIAYSDFSSDDDSDTDLLESDYDFGVHMINLIPHVLPIQEDPPLPLAKVHLLTDAYANPIPVIAFFDTGSSVSILNPNILPDHYWKPHHQNFMAANGEKIVIDKISVPINIRLFPNCVIKRRLLGSSSHGKDLLIGFDILHKLPNLRWSGEGLHYRSFFNPWTAKHRLFVSSITPPIFSISSIKQRLIQSAFKKSLFQHLADARILSKFDLKSGFWQLDFLPKLSHHTALLFPMLKKNPPQWTSRQTEAVKAIKCLAEKMPPLKIPASSKKRILQTDRKGCVWCERKLRTLYADIRSLMARANGVEPDKITYYVMWNISVWNKDHPDAYKWIEANGQWLYDNFDHCDVETSDDDDDARSLWSSDDDEHFDHSRWTRNTLMSSSIDLHQYPLRVDGVMSIWELNAVDTKLQSAPTPSAEPCHSTIITTVIVFSFGQFLLNCLELPHTHSNRCPYDYVPASTVSVRWPTLCMLLHHRPGLCSASYSAVVGFDCSWKDHHTFFSFWLTSDRHGSFSPSARCKNLDSSGISASREFDLTSCCAIANANTGLHFSNLRVSMTTPSVHLKSKAIFYHCLLLLQQFAAANSWSIRPEVVPQ
ncbi:putative zinc finger, CCHC-type containing protein [Tanacetum coccineum]